VGVKHNASDTMRHVGGGQAQRRQRDAPHRALSASIAEQIADADNRGALMGDLATNA
jgi:hypothetical protein